MLISVYNPSAFTEFTESAAGCGGANIPNGVAESSSDSRSDVTCYIHYYNQRLADSQCKHK